MTKKLWFRAKRYGWGWTPCSWEGWLVIFLAVIAIFYSVPRRHSDFQETPYLFFIKILLILFILIFICYKKGEKPGWRWGNKKGERSKE